MRKSIKLAPGVRLNVSKRGVGMSVGAGGVRYSVHSSGRRTISARSGVPGVWYQKQTSTHTRARSVAARPRSSSTTRSRSRSVPVTAPALAPTKPGLFAPKGDKHLYKAIETQDLKAMAQVGDEHPEYRAVAYGLSGMLTLNQDRARAKKLLEDAFAAGDPAAHPFMSKYPIDAHFTVHIAEGVTAEFVGINRSVIGLTLGEIYQSDGDLDRAIGVVQQLEPTMYAAVSLAELYAMTGKYDEVIKLTEGIQNEDDASALLCAYRGVAFRQEGYHDAAHESLKLALRSRSRAEPIRHFALSERAKNYLAQGKKSMARRDLERILAEDSDFEDVRERLAELEAS
jgi:tetratricopeptide (TPR) repeat protein